MSNEEVGIAPPAFTVVVIETWIGNAHLDGEGSVVVKVVEAVHEVGVDPGVFTLSAGN